MINIFTCFGITQYSEYNEMFSLLTEHSTRGILIIYFEFDFKKF